MANQGKTTLQFNQVTSLYDLNDRLVIVYAADTANTANAIAQTATITVGNYIQSIANSIQIATQQPDPSHSNSLTITQGIIFTSNSYIYVAVANNYVLRSALSSF